MDESDRPNLRTTGPDETGSAAPSANKPPEAYGVNASAELVADLIAATGLLAADRIAQVRGRAAQTRGSFPQALLDEGLATGDGLARLLATRHQLPFVELAFTGVDPETATLIPLHVLERIQALPYALRDDTLFIAIADPANVHAIDELRLATRYPVELGVAAREEILDHVKRLVRQSEAFGARAAVEEQQELTVEEEEELADLDAEDGASDIHFEPQEDSLVVRYRIDGVLQEVQRIPKRLMAGVITRVKVLAKLDIAERRRPQDGRMSLNAAAAGRLLDVRIATLPTVEGESLVMRLLDKSKRAPTLQELGLADEMRDELSRILQRPTGALLVTGPTGSGKSTTLYAGLSQINRPEINVITVEDPVEYRLPGINQVQ